MTKVLYNKFDKKLITGLPTVSFTGRIIVVFTVADARKAVDFLLRNPILGLDTETRPCFKRGRQNVVSLLQVATPHVCFLFRLNLIGLPPEIIHLLEDTTVPKVGLSLHDDVLSLSKRASFTPGAFIDLQHLVKDIGIEDMSLQKLYANFFGMKISKSQQLSNWEADVLTERQKLYAATDAWACIKIYKEYLRLRETHDYTLQIIDEPSNPITHEENLP